MSENQFIFLSDFLIMASYSSKNTNSIRYIVVSHTKILSNERPKEC